MLTHRHIETFKAFIGRVSGSTYMLNPDPVEQEKNKAAALALADRVSAYTRFAYALGRNDRIVDGVLGALQKLLKNEKLEAYQKAHAALVAEKLEPEEMAKREAALKEEHDFENMVTEHNRRFMEIMDSEVFADDGKTPLSLYRINVADLPGWNDKPDTAERDRNGLLSMGDLRYLDELGVLYNPADAVAAPTPGPKN